MSYENVMNKVKRLEEIGYLNRGDSSVEYMTKNPFIISRFINDDMSREGEKYFRQKLRDFLIKEKVLFEFQYSLLVLPTFALSNIINGASSYTEMAFKLENLDYVKVKNVTDEGLSLVFVSNGKTLQLRAESLQYILGDGVKATNINRYIQITSDRCSSINEKEQIDKLFD